MSTNNSSQKGLPWNTMVDLDKLTVRLIPYNGRNLLTWAAFLNQECIGNISLEIHPGKKLKFIDAWVHPDFRRLGIYRTLWDIRWEYCINNYKGYKTFAWCKEKSFPLFKEKGYTIGEMCTYVEKDLEN